MVLRYLGATGDHTCLAGTYRPESSTDSTTFGLCPDLMAARHDDRGERAAEAAREVERSRPKRGFDAEDRTLGEEKKRALDAARHRTRPALCCVTPPPAHRAAAEP